MTTIKLSLWATLSPPSSGPSWPCSGTAGACSGGWWAGLTWSSSEHADPWCSCSSSTISSATRSSGPSSGGTAAFAQPGGPGFLAHCCGAVPSCPCSPRPSSCWRSTRVHTSPRSCGRAYRPIERGPVGGIQRPGFSPGSSSSVTSSFPRQWCASCPRLRSGHLHHQGLRHRLGHIHPGTHLPGHGDHCPRHTGPSRYGSP